MEKVMADILCRQQDLHWKARMIRPSQSGIQFNANHFQLSNAEMYNIVPEILHSFTFEVARVRP
jgi:hypothetical protein